MIAYHGREDLKSAVLAIVQEHEDADRIISGTYEKLGKTGEWLGGCAVGCTLESVRRVEGLSMDALDHSDHALYERYLGVPETLARLEDGIFEGLPSDERLTWPRRFLAAIKPGSDLSMVWPRFALRLLTDPEGGVQRRVAQTKNPKVGPAVAAVADLYRRWVNGDKPPTGEWIAARRSAASDADAAYADAYAAAYAADADASDADASDADAADAAAAAAAAAAYAAAYAAAAAARLAERRRQAAWLIELLEAA